jgi:hypothetical protein
MRRRNRTTRSGLFGAIGIVVIVALAAGCSDDTNGRVLGRVRFNDRPLTSGTVIFTFPDGKTRTGEIDENGAYRVRDVPVGLAKVTVKTGSRVPPGLYPPKDVAIPPPPGAGKEPEPVKIPKRYQDPNSSGLSCNVRAGEQPFDIDLRP